MQRRIDAMQPPRMNAASNYSEGERRAYDHGVAAYKAQLQAMLANMAEGARNSPDERGQD